MKPPSVHEDGPATGSGRLEEISAALRAGKLVELLTGKGLAKSTVAELLRPESVATLRAILSRQPLPRGDAMHTRRPDRAGHHGCGRGKVLAFRPKEANRR